MSLDACADCGTTWLAAEPLPCPECPPSGVLTPPKPKEHLTPVEATRWDEINQRLHALRTEAQRLTTERRKLDNTNRNRNRYAKLGKADRYARKVRGV